MIRKKDEEKKVEEEEKIEEEEATNNEEIRRRGSLLSTVYYHFSSFTSFRFSSPFPLDPLMIVGFFLSLLIDYHWNGFYGIRCTFVHASVGNRE